MWCNFIREFDTFLIKCQTSLKTEITMKSLKFIEYFL